MLFKLSLFTLISTSLAFRDTGSLLSNRPLTNDYVIHQDNVINFINDNYCDNAVQIYETYHGEELEFDNFHKINHVLYDNINQFGELSKVCNGKVEVIRDLSKINLDNLVLIQEIPEFNHDYINFEKIRKMFSTIHKRDGSDEDLIDGEFIDQDLILEEIEQDFEAVESMIAQENENDQPMHILDDTSYEKTNTNSTTTNHSLFNTYQFFSPGIFMCLIVSFLLVFIFSVALQWTSSIQITYESFEKDVDYVKKNE